MISIRKCIEGCGLEWWALVTRRDWIWLGIDTKSHSNSADQTASLEKKNRRCFGSRPFFGHIVGMRQGLLVEHRLRGEFMVVSKIIGGTDWVDNHTLFSRVEESKTGRHSEGKYLRGIWGTNFSHNVMSTWNELPRGLVETITCTWKVHKYERIRGI